MEAWRWSEGMEVGVGMQLECGSWRWSVAGGGQWAGRGSVGNKVECGHGTALWAWRCSVGVEVGVGMEV